MIMPNRQVEQKSSGEGAVSNDPPRTRDGSITAWLDIFEQLLRGSASRRRAIREELDSHLRDRVRDLVLCGRDDAEAVQQAVRELGDAASLARSYRSVDRGQQRRLLMHIAALGMGATALTLSVTTLTMSDSQSSSRVPTAIFAQTPANHDDTKWVEQATVTGVGAMTLENLAGWFEASTDHALIVRWSDLENVGIDGDKELDLGSRERNLTAALDEIVEQLDPEWNSISWRAEAHRVVIGSQERFDRLESTLVTYEVGEVIEQLTSWYIEDYQTAVDEIRDLLQSFVEPEAWEDNGGTVARLRVVGGTLFIDAPPRMHERAAWLLEQLAAHHEEAAAEPVDPRDALLEMSSRDQ